MDPALFGTRWLLVAPLSLLPPSPLPLPPNCIQLMATSAPLAIFLADWHDFHFEQIQIETSICISSPIAIGAETIGRCPGEIHNDTNDVIQQLHSLQVIRVLFHVFLLIAHVANPIHFIPAHTQDSISRRPASSFPTSTPFHSSLDTRIAASKLVGTRFSSEQQQQMVLPTGCTSGGSTGGIGAPTSGSTGRV